MENDNEINELRETCRKLQARNAELEAWVQQVKFVVGGAPIQQAENRVAAFDLIKLERKRQDEKWGGPEHDDEHEADDWQRFIYTHTDMLLGDLPTHRKQLARIAALAVAALESSLRKYGSLKAEPTEPADNLSDYAEAGDVMPRGGE